MKSYVSKLLVVLLASQGALAGQKYEFRYSFEGENLAVSQEASDYYQALERAAKSCFQHFRSKTKSNHNKGIDLIDVCANPKSS